METFTSELERENEDLRRRLGEAEDALRAIRAGEVDAFVVQAGREQVYTLEEPRNPYRLLVAQVPSAALTLTAEGSIVSCNTRFARLLQRAPAELHGRSIRDFVAPESREALDAKLEQCSQGGVKATILFMRDDGTLASTYLGFAPLREGALGPCVLVTDLTEQRHYQELLRAQRALRGSEERLEKDLAAAERLQEISTQLIQQGDAAQLQRQILSAAMDLTRSDFATMQAFDPSSGTLERLAYRGFDDDFGRVFRRVGPDSGTTCGLALSRRERVLVGDLATFEELVGTADAQELLVRGVVAMQSTPLISRTGELLGMISTHWREPHEPNVRDLRLLDVLARQAADLLERSVREQALREADRKKDEFLATLAHELRNPLAPVRNAVEILKAMGPAASQLTWAREVIDRQVQTMARLLDDLLDVSRIAHDKPELQRRSVQLAEVVDAAVETSRPLIEAARHELSITLPSVPVNLYGDPVRLAQTFGNLLNNAAKYTDEGGRIRLVAEREGREVVVRVEDSGIGIAPDLLAKIFELFSQASPGVVRSQGGLGIGLSLVKGLVELHGGTVEARSEGPGKGSAFIVRLPVVEDAPSEPAGPAGESPEPRRQPRRRVLVVDDNRDSADSLATLLRVLGHEAHTAYDGEHGLQAAATLRPDVVLLDIGMPRVSGYDVCRRLRAEPWGRAPVLVALTGWGQEEDRRRSVEAGFDHHMVKPVSTAELMDLLASAPASDAGAA